MQRILVVDGDRTAAHGLAARLAGYGYAVAGMALSGSDAITLAVDTAPHLVLMAIALPGDVDGFAAADEIRLRRPVPIVFMSGEGEGVALPRAGLAAPFRYLVKPFTEGELRGQLETALRADEPGWPIHELEEGFFAVSVDMVCCLAFNGTFERLNPAWERTLGFTRAELMSKPFIEFVHPEDRARTLNQNREVRAGGEARSFENRYLCKDGSYRWLRWNAAAHSPKQLIFSIARDITENKQADAEREQLVRALQAALAEVQTLNAILPICSYCKKIRSDESYWLTVEAYIARHTSTTFTHSICPACYEKEVEPQFK